MNQLLFILLFTLSCNLDTLILTLSYALRGVVLSGRAVVAVAAITSAVTGLSLLLGDLVGHQLNGAAAHLGSLVLIGMGLWTILDWMRQPKRPEQPRFSGSITLAAALAMNNAGAGVAAGVSGLGAVEGAIGNFLVTLAFVALGRFLAHRMRGGQLAKYALPISGALLILLGGLTFRA